MPWSSFDGGTSGSRVLRVTCRTHPAAFAEAGGHPIYLKNKSYPSAQCQTVMVHGMRVALLPMCRVLEPAVMLIETEWQEHRIMQHVPSDI